MNAPLFESLQVIFEVIESPKMLISNYTDCQFWSDMR